jgi:hypothetical protein
LKVYRIFPGRAAPEYVLAGRRDFLPAIKALTAITYHSNV